MSLIGSFSVSAALVEQPPAVQPKRKREAPFAIRLSKDERARLEREAAGAPLGTYIKAKVFGSAPPVRTRRTGLAVEDRQALAQALALLGRSRLSNNLNQLARLAHIGALPLTPETEAELSAALGDVRDIRRRRIGHDPQRLPAREQPESGRPPPAHRRQRAYACP